MNSMVNGESIILFGPPGAGKGTQSGLISTITGKPQVSTGDILREAVSDNSEVGREAKSYMDKGLLVPDKIIMELIKIRLSKDDAKNGLLFDGFPRTIPQAMALEKLTSVSMVVSLVVQDDEIVSRIAGRRTDPETGEIYHVEYKPAPQDIRSRLLQRDDDTEDTVRNRLSTFHKQTAPLSDFYRDKGILIEVDGSGDIEQVSSSIEAIIKRNSLD
ncbi:MAG: adenylate kinase [Candidatus Thermoplasmatota archaeon]|nr:adenylate kinase [Candidatus Thermoplasmatota archaeon]MEC8045426.1 adenylate kinase [Candidatus Thermoplasmatota archaeon]MEC9138065.1 adenylate kinase [Candidatus Thermoplasmatota archaeon]|tara:strand:+ start:864 stop:1511 length:648 start_codon:yes stop_codon:yes gene_type:complete